MASAQGPSSRWIGALFAVGATCFAVASLPIYFDAVTAAFVAWTFFVGSVFFTTAALLQLVQAARRHELVLASAVQFAGTLLFNLSTFAATRADLSMSRERHLIWAPDVYGSICFLVASWLAYAAVNRGVLPRRDGTLGWWVAALNLLGSGWFGVAAVAARYVGSDGAVANVAMVNLGTCLGAVCFFVAAVVLPRSDPGPAVASGVPVRP